MKHQELATRSNWYAAYLTGDTAPIAEFEDPSFFVVTESGVQPRTKQLEGIDAAVRMERWLPAGSCSEDRHLDLHEESESLVSARGVGRVATPGGANPVVLFTELGQRTDQSWRVLHLHYHEAKWQRGMLAPSRTKSRSATTMAVAGELRSFAFQVKSV